MRSLPAKLENWWSSQEEPTKQWKLHVSLTQTLVEIKVVLWELTALGDVGSTAHRHSGTGDIYT